MADVLPFKRPSPSERHRGKTLCKSGFHRWETMPGDPFDVKQGRLVTRQRCVRCGATRVEAR